eukprot:g67563.t1
MLMCQAGGETNRGRSPMVTTSTQSTPGGRRAKLINKACWAWAEGEVCNYGENCRFRHSCPACPGKKDHRKDTCPNSTSSKWDFKKPKQG